MLDKKWWSLMLNFPHENAMCCLGSDHIIVHIKRLTTVLAHLILAVWDIVLLACIMILTHI